MGGATESKYTRCWVNGWIVGSSVILRCSEWLHIQYIGVSRYAWTWYPDWPDIQLLG